MKTIFIALFLATLLGGCTTNRSLIKQIQALEQQYDGDVLHDRELYFDQQKLRYELWGRGYLDRQEFLIHGIKPKTPQWEEMENHLAGYLRSGESLVGLIEFGDYDMRTSKPVHVTIWDRPDSMEGWKELVFSISKKGSEQIK